MAKIPLFVDTEGRVVTKTLSSSTSPIYSNDIKDQPESSFSAIIPYITVTGTVSISIGLQYKDDSTGKYGSTVSIQSAITTTGMYQKRLDAQLGANWVPKLTFRYVFTLDSGSGSAVIEGDHLS